LYAPLSASKTMTRRFLVAVGHVDLVGTGIHFRFAGRPRRVVSALFVCGPILPICSTNLPSCVNLRT
jgi:hypothetical protein